MRTWISFASFSAEMNKLAAEGKLPLAKAESKIFNALLRGSPVKVRVTPDAAQFGGGYFDQVSKEIGISEKSYEALAHEVGHAHVDQHILGRQSRAARLASGIVPGVLAGVGAGLLMAKGKKWGLLLPAALSAPTVISEALASHKGSKLLEEHGASEEQQESYRQRMRQGMMSYLLAPILGTLVASAR
jgi:hypothetical protein